VLYGTLSGEPIQVDPRLVISGPRTIEGFWLGHWMRQRSIPKALLLFLDIAALIRLDVLRSEIARVYPLAEIEEAAQHAAIVARQGKVLVKFH
jgi:NADPH:quinone reductase